MLFVVKISYVYKHNLSLLFWSNRVLSKAKCIESSLTDPVKKISNFIFIFNCVLFEKLVFNIIQWHYIN
jgi:hypothetical protein